MFMAHAMHEQHRQSHRFTSFERRTVCVCSTKFNKINFNYSRKVALFSLIFSLDTTHGMRWFALPLLLCVCVPPLVRVYVDFTSLLSYSASFFLSFILFFSVRKHTLLFTSEFVVVVRGCDLLLQNKKKIRSNSCESRKKNE